MSRLLNYIYFRLAKVYYKWDGEEADTASIGIAMLLFALFNNSIIMLRVLIFGFTPFSEFTKKYIILLYLGLVFGFLYFVKRKYKAYPIKENNWNNLPKSKARIHTVLIFIAGLVFIIGIPMLILGNWWP